MAQALISLISVNIGILVPGLLIFIISYKSTRSLMNLSLLLVSVAGILINLFEGGNILASMIWKDAAMAVEMNRLLEIVNTALLVLLPMVLGGSIPKESQIHKNLYPWYFWISLAVAIIIIAVHIAIPDLFKSTTEFKILPETPDYGLGRGVSGPFRLIRDAAIGISILFFAAVMIWSLFKEKRPTIYQMAVAVAVFLPILGGIEDLMQNYRGEFLFLNAYPIPRLIPTLTLFILTSVGAAFLQFMREAQQVKSAHQALKASQDQLVYLALNDKLTGLPNQKAFFDKLDDVLAHARRDKELRALVLIDVDNFKAINDNFGFSMGDKLLAQVGKSILDEIRETDFLGRIGGDELGLILQDIEHPTQVALVAQKIMSRMSEPVTIDGHDFIITISMGISIIPLDSDERNPLMRKCDEALFEAKKDKNAFRFYTPTTNAEAHNRLAILNELRHAIDHDGFQLYFQPLVGRDEKICGCEALLRWKQSSGEFMSPAVFIPVAESTGLIHNIGQWVIKEGCELTHKIQQEFPNIFVSINLSAKQLANQNLPQIIKEEMARNHILDHGLHLEITETALMESHAQVMPILKEFQQRDLHLAIDDFGVGYSSLSYLRTLPVMTLKIDRSFVMNLPDESKDAAIVRSVIDMAQGLGLKVVAEGVESRVQADFLWKLGCDYIQGYFFSHPLPLEDFLGLLRL